MNRASNLDIARSLRIRAISICDAEACGVQASAANRTGGVNPAAPLESGALRPFGRKLHEGSCNFRAKDTARLLRRNTTSAEKKLWACFRNRKFAGKKFRRQHPFDPYILDFYCAEENLNIEIDGGQHDFSEHRTHDARRSAFLRQHGVRTLRIWNSQVRDNLEGVLKRIRLALKNSPSPQSSPLGGEEDGKCAFTLIELIVTIVVSSIVILALVAVFHEAVKGLGRQNPLRSATVLADDLVHEIRSKEFTDPQTPQSFGSEEGAIRRNFDDVDDYDDWSKSPPETIEGSVMTNYSGFTRSVTVEYDPPGDTNAVLKRITVTVSGPDVVISNVSVVSKWD